MNMTDRTGSSNNLQPHLSASETNIYAAHDLANPTNLSEIIQSEYKISVPFFNGSFEDAKRAAQSLNRYLIVYLHCPTHEKTSSFVKNVLHDAKVMSTLRDTAVIYGASVMDREGHRLSMELHATTYPFVAVLYQRALVMRLQGVHARGMFLAEWKKCTDLWDGVVAEETSLRADRELREREQRRAEEREAADRERLARVRQEALDKQERERAVEAAARRRSEEEVQQDAQRLDEEARRASTRQTNQDAARARLPAEPPSDVESERVTQINLRCPSGRQYFRRFWRTDWVESLYDFALSVDDYDGGEVQLLVGIPPKPLVWTDGVTKFNDVPSLTPRVTVLMRSKSK